MTTNLNINRGEIWLVSFDPTIGEEIQKTRPAVVVSLNTTFRYRLRIVVPITGWQSHFASDFWMIHLKPDTANALDKESAANAFQVKSLSEERFVRNSGSVSSKDIEDICSAIAFCIGYTANS